MNSPMRGVSQFVPMPTVVVTRGGRGCLARSGQQRLSQPAFAVTPVDTTGAGDLYAAGFLYGWSQDMPLDQCGRLGSLAAAAVIGHLGPRPGISLAQMIELS